MKRVGFTIIELVIAIAIFSIIVIYMYQAVGTTKKANVAYEKNYDIVAKQEEVKRLIYNDIFNQADPYKDISFGNGVFYLRSNNSLHNFASPYLAYFVRDKKLIRVESARKLSISAENTQDTLPLYEVDTFLENVEHFEVLKKENNYLFTWKQGAKRVAFEIKLPYYRKVVIVQSNDTNRTK